MTMTAQEQKLKALQARILVVAQKKFKSGLAVGLFVGAAVTALIIYGVA